jgi:hypothetical protein
VVYSSFRQFSDYEEEYEKEYEETPKKEKPHKQTYLEYVQERLKIEKLMRRGG